MLIWLEIEGGKYTAEEKIQSSTVNGNFGGTYLLEHKNISNQKLIVNDIFSDSWFINSIVTNVYINEICLHLMEGF